MNPRKILLIYTDKYYMIKQVYPFGLDLISDYLRRHGYDVTIEYPFFPDLDLEKNLKNILEREDPQVIGIGIRNLDTCMSCEPYGDYGGEDYSTFYFLPHIKRIVDIVKEDLPEIPIVAGGGGFSISPEAILKYLGIEYGVIGEGEEAFRQFLDVFPEKRKMTNIPNLIYHDDGYIINPRQEPNPEIRTTLSVREGKFKYAFEASGLPMKIKRGCNQNCSYCVEPFIEGKRFFFRDVGRVIDELKHISQTQRDTRNIFFVDTESNLPDYSYCTQLLERVIKEGLHMHFGFSSQFLPKPFDNHLAELLAKVGFSIILTCDSFADEVLAQNNTSYRQKDIIRTLELCENHGIGCTLSMIMGLPGETYETIDHSLEWINRYSPNFLRRYEYTFGGRIYPNTPLCKYIEGKKCENHLYGDRSEGYIAPYYYCSPESPMKLKEYVEKALGYSISYQGRYNEDSHRALSLAYLADQGKWNEVISGFSKCQLSSQLSIYEYLFRKLVIAERQEDARRMSENLLRGIPANNMDGQYDDYLNLIRFFLSQLG